MNALGHQPESFARQKKFVFGDCEIELDCREVRLRGIAQAAPPKVFELLVFLIKHRARVVHKHELLAHVWPGVVVSDGVVAVTVMKARKAIGDLSETAPLIKTVRRVGYRFAGALSNEHPVAAADTPDATVGGLLRIALLPFENETGDAQMKWVELGLMSLVGQALKLDRRVSLSTPAVTLGALKDMPTLVTPAAQALALENLLGLQCVIHTTVKHPTKGFEIEFSGFGSSGKHIVGRLCGEELTAMGLQLADELGRQLFRGVHSRASFSSTDPLANQAFARALQLLGEDRWDMAARLLRVVLDIEPDNVAAELALLKALIHLGDDTAFERGERLVARADPAADSRFAACVRATVGQGCLQANIKDAVGQARRHLDQSLELIGTDEDEDWIVDVYIARALVAQLQRDYTTAHYFCEAARRMNAPTHNVLRDSTILSRQAILESTSGNRLRARTLFEDAVEIFAAHGLTGREVFGLGALAQINTWLGFLVEGMRYCDRVEAALPAIRSDIRATAFGLAWISVVHAETRALPRLQRLLDLAEPMKNHALPIIQAGWLIVRAHHAAAANNWDVACDSLSQAVDMATAYKAWMMVQFWMPALLHMLARADRRDEAARRRAQALALSAERGDDLELQGSVLYSAACELHATGSTQAAAGQLDAAIRTLPAGRWAAYARLDAAWLCAERGDAAAARALLRDLGPWLQSHPLGMLVDGRIKFASGDWQGACAVQVRHVDVMGQTPDAFVQALQLRYIAAAKQGSAPESLPLAPRLPSLI